MGSRARRGRPTAPRRGSRRPSGRSVDHAASSGSKPKRPRQGSRLRVGLRPLSLRVGVGDDAASPLRRKHARWRRRPIVSGCWMRCCRRRRARTGCPCIKPRGQALDRRETLNRPFPWARRVIELAGEDRREQPAYVTSGRRDDCTRATKWCTAGYERRAKARDARRSRSG